MKSGVIKRRAPKKVAPTVVRRTAPTRPAARLPAETVSYYRGMPDRSGLRRYMHLVRLPAVEPPETMGRGAGQRDSTHWTRVLGDSSEAWAEKIAKLMADGEPRTFNAICIELTGTTADVWFDKPPDMGLWDLVREGKLAWTNETPILFIDSRFVEWPR